MPNGTHPHIAFLVEGFVGWTGGIDFLRQCMAGIDAVLPHRTWNVLFPEKTPEQRALALAIRAKRRLWAVAGLRPAIDSRLSETQVRDALGSTGCEFQLIRYRSDSKGLRRAVRDLGSDAVLACCWSPGTDFPTHWLGYYADLQHKRLPGNFSEYERTRRDRELEELLEDAPAIIVPSNAVVRDIDEFYPKHRARLFGLPFCPISSEAFFNDGPEDLLRRYDLPKKFFIISNQFWIHKSHQTAFDALRVLRQSGFDDVHVLCTGNTHDFRSPEYFERLTRGVVRDGLSDRIRFLGMLPKRDQLAIMRRSVALIQPTLFEGSPGGLAVCDAVATGTPAIVTDIEVNRGADLGVIEFFQAGSSEDLAHKMMAALNEPPHRLSSEATLNMLEQRRKVLGNTLMDAVSCALSVSSGVARGKVQSAQGHA